MEVFLLFDEALDTQAHAREQTRAYTHTHTHTRVQHGRCETCQSKRVSDIPVKQGILMTDNLYRGKRDTHTYTQQTRVHTDIDTHTHTHT